MDEELKLIRTLKGSQRGIAVGNTFVYEDSYIRRGGGYGSRISSTIVSDRGIVFRGDLPQFIAGRIVVEFYSAFSACDSYQIRKV